MSFDFYILSGSFVVLMSIVFHRHVELNHGKALWKREHIAKNDHLITHRLKLAIKKTSFYVSGFFRSIFNIIFHSARYILLIVAHFVHKQSSKFLALIRGKTSKKNKGFVSLHLRNVGQYKRGLSAGEMKEEENL